MKCNDGRRETNDEISRDLCLRSFESLYSAVLFPHYFIVYDSLSLLLAPTCVTPRSTAKPISMTWTL